MARERRKPIGGRKTSRTTKGKISKDPKKAKPSGGTAKRPIRKTGAVKKVSGAKPAAKTRPAKASGARPAARPSGARPAAKASGARPVAKKAPSKKVVKKAPVSTPEAIAPPPKKEKEEKKIVFPKLKKEGETSTPKEDRKTRVQRSLKERSKLPFLVFLIIVSAVTGFVVWYNKGTPERMVGTLKFVKIDSKIAPNVFKPKTNHYLATYLQMGPVGAAPIVPKYDKLPPNAQLAAIVIFGELKAPEGLGIVTNALMNKDKRLSSYAQVAAGKYGDAAVTPLKDMLKPEAMKKHKPVLYALGMTQSTKALDILLGLLQSKSAEVQKLAVEAMANFGQAIREGKTDSVKNMVHVAVNGDETVARTIIEVLHNFRVQGDLQILPEEMINQRAEEFLNEKDAKIRARLLSVMGVLGLCKTENGDNYIEKFRSSARNALNSNEPKELAAAAEALGYFQDNETEILDKLLANLGHDNKEVTFYVAKALANLDDGKVPTKILNGPLVSTDQEHVLTAIAGIIDSYYLYVTRLDLSQKAVEFATKAMFKVGKKTRGKLSQIALKYVNGIENVKKRKELSKDSLDLTFQAIGKTTGKEVEDYLKALFVYAVGVSDAKERLNLIFQIIELTNKSMGKAGRNTDNFSELNFKLMKEMPFYYQVTQEPANPAAWSKWFEKSKTAKKLLAQIENLQTQAKSKIQTKTIKDAQEADKILKQAGDAHAKLVKLTKYSFEDIEKDIASLKYESKKARPFREGKK